MWLSSLLCLAPSPHLLFHLWPPVRENPGSPPSLIEGKFAECPFTWCRGCTGKSKSCGQMPTSFVLSHCCSCAHYARPLTYLTPLSPKSCKGITIPLTQEGMDPEKLLPAQTAGRDFRRAIGMGNPVCPTSALILRPASSHKLCPSVMSFHTQIPPSWLPGALALHMSATHTWGRGRDGSPTPSESRGFSILQGKTPHSLLLLLLLPSITPKLKIK